MFYPTLENRCLVCMKDEAKEIEEAINKYKDSDILESIKKWLDEKSYCLEKRQLEEYLADKGIVKKLHEDDMGVGAPVAPASGLSNLGNVGGMGNPTAPSNDGTNAGFYDASKVGSGDKFTTLSVGTSAANKRKKGKKTLLSYLDFIKSKKR